MRFCTKCGAIIDETTMKFCPKCGTPLISFEPNDTKLKSQPDDIIPKDIKSSDITPDTIEPTEITPTTAEPTNIQPTSIKPTPIEPTPIEPTSIKPKPIKPFSMKTLLLSAFGSIVGFVALSLALRYLTGTTRIPAALIFAVMGIAGIVVILQQIGKLPIDQLLTDKFATEFKAGNKSITADKLSPIQKIRFRLASANSNTRIASIGALAAIALTVAITVPVALFGGAGVPTTSITGVWIHELGQDNADPTWATNVTMWAVDEDDPGSIYMNEGSDGNFTVTYESTIVSFGTWLETSNNNYQFIHHDPGSVLSDPTLNYQISGNTLIQGLGPNSTYFIKQS